MKDSLTPRIFSGSEYTHLRVASVSRSSLVSSRIISNDIIVKLQTIIERISKDNDVRIGTLIALANATQSVIKNYLMKIENYDPIKPTNNTPPTLIIVTINHKVNSAKNALPIPIS